ncbi:hypothetical protein STSP2_00204 [Anaerohalosphaera lusitana]|uniref:Uncharacterized protein n=1 Tax=Anaerohalosphaera lusitana TaxID=1936003 RepID=A0A1U9NH48_9BACT|nr:hypothetical protein STSP2_00204 [Anaerohalosphaera lusitana]
MAISSVQQRRPVLAGKNTCKTASRHKPKQYHNHPQFSSNLYPPKATLRCHQPRQSQTPLPVIPDPDPGSSMKKPSRSDSLASPPVTPAASHVNRQPNIKYVIRLRRTQRTPRSRIHAHQRMQPTKLRAATHLPKKSPKPAPRSSRYNRATGP